MLKFFADKQTHRQKDSAKSICPQSINAGL